MLYLISGASRSGKTMVARKLASQKRIPYLSLDWIMMGFTNGIPEYGIHDLLMPDEIARGLWDFLKAMFESMIHADTNCIIEGEALLPELIIELLKEYPNKVKICFLGFIDLDVKQKVKEIKDYSDKQNDWLRDKQGDYITDHVYNMIAHSRMMKKSCEDYAIKYIDTSKDFSESINTAVNYLLS